MEEPAGHNMLPQPKRGGLQAKPKWSLPKRKIEAADNLMAFPKMKSKPADTDEFKRAVSARSADDRKRVREFEDDSERPWDARGPRGPQEGGPHTWMGQKFREGSGRWANAGGQHRKEYSFYHRKKMEGCTGVDLQYYHPLVPAQLSGLTRLVVRDMVCGDRPMNTVGIILLVGRERRLEMVRIHFHATLADEEALSAMLGLKGSSGISPCAARCWCVDKEKTGRPR